MRKLCSMLGLLGLAVVVGCDGDGSSRDRSLQPLPQNGTLAVSVTDQPIPADCFDEASVTISRIEIYPVGVTLTGSPTGPTGPTLTPNIPGVPGGPTNTASFNPPQIVPPNSGFPLDPGGFVTPTATQPIVISPTARTFNLLDLRGGVTEQVAVVTAPVGTYDRVRIFLENGALTFIAPTGTAGAAPVTFTAGEPVLITISPPLQIDRNQFEELILDFDLGQTFRTPTGTTTVDCAQVQQLANAGQVEFTPTVRAFGRSDSVRIGGILTDGFGLPISGADVNVTGGGLAPGTQFTTSTGGIGSAAGPGSFGFLLPAGTTAPAPFTFTFTNSAGQLLQIQQTITPDLAGGDLNLGSVTGTATTTTGGTGF